MQDIQSFETVLSHRIHHEVVEGKNGHLFLSGCSHQVEHYLFGINQIKEESIQNFQDNLIARKRYCEQHGAKYVHLVCPDKPSVYRHQYPISDLKPLGQRYQEQADVDFLYPVAALTKALDTHEVYHKTDSHWNERGGMVVFEELMVKTLGFSQSFTDDALDAYQSRGWTKERFSHGDLGKKTTPPHAEEIEFLNKNKAVIFLNNGCTRNMGLIRSMYNPLAKTQQRILLFADSFAASLMYLFSEVFEHVVFVRSQYLHREMVAALRPDVVITANAERYLAYVHRDDEAGIAFFVALLNGLNFDKNNPFYEYIDAITKRSPKAFEDFFTKYSTMLFQQEKKPDHSVMLVNAWQAAGHHLSVNLALLRSRCSAVLKDLDQSWRDAEYALQISNHSITTIGHAVAVRLHQKEYQSALTLCQQLIEKNPKSWLGYRSAAVALRGLNRKAEGFVYLEQGIRSVDEPSELLKLKESY